MFRLLLSLLFLLVLPSPVIAQRYVDQFSVDGIDIDVKGPTAEDARAGAFREAAKRGWSKLWDKLVDPSYRGQAPHVSDGDVYHIVSAYDVSNERMSATRYIARFSITYDPAAVRNALARAGAGFTQGHDRSMLLLPWLVDGGTNALYDSGNSWALAWGKFPLIHSRIDYVRADGTLGDTLLLNAQAARGRTLERVQPLLNRYRAAGIVVAKAVLSRSYPGGPVRGEFFGFTGLEPAPIVHFILNIPNDRYINDMFIEAIPQLDRAFSESAKAVGPATVAPQPIAAAIVVGTEDVRVPTADTAMLDQWIKRLSSIRTVTSVTVAELALGGDSRLRLAASEGHDMLAYELDLAGLHWNPDGSLRNRLPGEPSLPRPVTARDEEADAAKEAVAGASQLGKPRIKPAAPPERPAKPAPVRKPQSPIQLLPPAAKSGPGKQP